MRKTRKTPSQFASELNSRARAEEAQALELVSIALANIMIQKQYSTKTMITGVHAFLLALEAAGCADAGEIARELDRMADCYHAKAASALTHLKAATG